MSTESTPGGVLVTDTTTAEVKDCFVLEAPIYTQAQLDAAVAAERERIFAHIRSAMGHAEAGYDDVAWRLLASLVGPNARIEPGASNTPK